MAVEATLAPAASQTVTPDQRSNNTTTGEIAYFSMGGRGYVQDQYELVHDHPGPPYVWESESLELRATVHIPSSEATKRVCGHVYNNDQEAITDIGCHTWNSTTERRYAGLELPEWPPSASGTHFIEIILYEEPRSDQPAANTDDTSDSSDFDVKDRHIAEVYVISKDGDLADNGLSNAREVELGTDFTKWDTSGNGLSDREEVFQYGTNPLVEDTTGDGIDDATVAQLGLPPTVPYIVHAVAVAVMIFLVAVVIGSIKLRRILRKASTTPTVESLDTVSTTSQHDTDGSVTRTKEEEILAILQTNGGRMKQADLVNETDWSKATVSRLLSSLENDGRVEKIRIGRGNVVRLIPTESPPDGHPTKPPN